MGGATVVVVDVVVVEVVVEATVVEVVVAGSVVVEATVVEVVVEVVVVVTGSSGMRASSLSEQPTATAANATTTLPRADLI